MYEDIIRAPKSCYGDHHVVAACPSQLKVRTQLLSRCHKKLADWAHVGLPSDFIQIEGTSVLINGVKY
jgi:hypothetical protein